MRGKSHSVGPKEDPMTIGIPENFAPWLYEDSKNVYPSSQTVNAITVEALVVR